MSRFKTGQVWEDEAGNKTAIRVLDHKIVDIDYYEEDADEMSESDKDYYFYSLNGTSFHDSNFNLIKLIEDVPEDSTTFLKGEIMSSIKDSLKSSLTDGAKDGASLAVSKKCTALLKEKLGDTYPAFFATDLGQIVEKIGTPVLLLVICEIAPQIPHSDKLKNAALHAFRAAVAENIGEVIDDFLPLLDNLSTLVESD